MAPECYCFEGVMVDIFNLYFWAIHFMISGALTTDPDTIWLSPEVSTLGPYGILFNLVL